MDMTGFETWMDETGDLSRKLMVIVQAHLEANPDFKFSAVVPSAQFVAAELSLRQSQFIPADNIEQAVERYRRCSDLALKIALENHGHAAPDCLAYLDGDSA